MIGTFVNVGTIIVGSLIGGLFKKIMSDRVNDALFIAMGMAAFGLGINPFGPKRRAKVLTSFMASVVETATSKSNQPPLIFSIKSDKPASHAPAFNAACGSFVKAITRTSLPFPFGSCTRPRTI